MYSYRVPGYILWGILGTWLLGIVAQLIGWYEVDPAAGVYSLIPSFAEGINLQAPYLFAFDFDFALSHIVDFAVIVFAFLFVDLFDTAGTLIGVASKGGLLDKEGRLPRAKELMRWVPWWAPAWAPPPRRATWRAAPAWPRAAARASRLS